MIKSLLTIPKQVLKDGIEYNTLFTYDYIEGVWISSISVYENKLINNSNHFIDLIVNDTQYCQETGNYNIKRKPTYIYTRIIQNYNNYNLQEKIYLFEQNIIEYYPYFKEHFEYYNFFESFKCKNNDNNNNDNNNDKSSRDININIKENIFNVWCGKISLIFNLDKHIDNFIY